MFFVKEYGFIGLINNIDKLPEKIQTHIFDKCSDNFWAAFKTSIKPNATIPLLWLVFHSRGLLFCNTHKTRGIFQEISLEEIDSFKFHRDALNRDSFSIIFKDIYEEDLVIELPKDIAREEMITLLSNYRIQII